MDRPGILHSRRKLKIVVIILNAVMWVMGLLLVVLGGYSLAELKNVAQLANITIPAGLIVLGLIFILVTVFGSLYAYREKITGLVFYTLLMMVLLICLIGVGGGIFTYRSQISSTLGEAWPKATDDQRNVAQKYFHCCGWGANYSHPGSNCLVNKTITVGKVTFTAMNSSVPDMTLPNCQGVIDGFVSQRLYVAAAAGVVIGVIEFVAMLFSLFLIVRICRDPEYRTYNHLTEEEDRVFGIYS